MIFARLSLAAVLVFLAPACVLAGGGKIGPPIPLQKHGSMQKHHPSGCGFSAHNDCCPRLLPALCCGVKRLMSNIFCCRRSCCSGPGKGGGVHQKMLLSKRAGCGKGCSSSGCNTCGGKSAKGGPHSVVPYIEDPQPPAPSAVRHHQLWNTRRPTRLLSTPNPQNGRVSGQRRARTAATEHNHQRRARTVSVASRGNGAGG